MSISAGRARGAGLQRSRELHCGGRVGAGRAALVDSGARTEDPRARQLTRDHRGRARSHVGASLGVVLCRQTAP